MIRFFSLLCVFLFLASNAFAASTSCGWTAQKFVEKGVSEKPICSLNTLNGKLEMFSATKGCNISESNWFSASPGSHPCVFVRECRGPKGDQVAAVDFSKVRKACSIAENGWTEIGTSQGNTVKVNCSNFVATEIQIGANGKTESCGLPKVLSIKSPSAKRPDSWYGLNSKQIEISGVDKSQICSLKVDDPSFPETLEFGFVWGAKGCSSGSGYGPCGWLAHNNGLSGDKMSDRLNIKKLKSLCAKSSNGEIEIKTTEMYTADIGKNKSIKDKRYMKAFLKCDSGIPKLIRLAVKSLPGKEQSKDCGLPRATLEDPGHGVSR